MIISLNEFRKIYENTENKYGLQLYTVYVTKNELSPMPSFTGNDLGNGEDQNRIFRNTKLYKEKEDYYKYFKPGTEIFKIGTPFMIASINNGVVIAETKSGWRYSFVADEFAASTTTETIN